MHVHGLFKTVQDLAYKERPIISNNNKYVLTNTNYISNPAPGLIHTCCVHSTPPMDHYVNRGVGDKRMILYHWWNDINVT
jgi:hypothetical protein